MRDETIQWTLEDGPRLDHPDWIFRDGAGIACVRAAPVHVPTWGTRVTAFDLDEFFVMTGVSLARLWWWTHVLKDHDDRWKVYVSRSTRRIPCFWRTVHIEFVADEEQAERRQDELLAQWHSARYSERPPLRWSQRRRLRLASRTPATT